MLEKLNSESFGPLVGQSFRVTTNGVAYDAVLVKLRELKPRGAHGGDSGVILPRNIRKSPFALLFCCPDEIPLGRDLSVFEHAALGRFSLLISPVGYDEEGRYYEAVFG
jgi:hypothetical protein